MVPLTALVSLGGGIRCIVLELAPQSLWDLLHADGSTGRGDWQLVRW